MPKYYPMPKHCLILATPFWFLFMPIMDILATTCLSLTFYQVWLGVFLFDLYWEKLPFKAGPSDNHTHMEWRKSMYMYYIKLT